MKIHDFTVSKRDGTRKGVTRKMRVKGDIPAVIYGMGEDPINATIDNRNFEYLLGHVVSDHPMINLQLGDDSAVSVLVKDIQRHPVTNGLTHVDFLRVDLSKPVNFEVRLHAKGSAAGVRLGGNLEQLLQTINIRCLPAVAPPEILVDVTALNIGDSIHISDLNLDDEIEVFHEPDESLFAVRAMREEEEPTVGDDDDEGTAEPEVLSAKAEEE